MTASSNKLTGSFSLKIFDNLLCGMRPGGTLLGSVKPDDLKSGVQFLAALNCVFQAKAAFINLFFRLLFVVKIKGLPLWSCRVCDTWVCLQHQGAKSGPQQQFGVSGEEGGGSAGQIGFSGEPTPAGRK